MDGVGEAADLLARYDAVLAKWSDPDADYEKLGAQQAELETEIEAAGAWDLAAHHRGGHGRPAPAARLTPTSTTLSGGERRRVALCRLLLAKPDLLLLDEPTNHLDAESVAWLERTLKDYPGTVVAVTHDRYFLDNVAGWILELDHGRGMPFEGNYSSLAGAEAGPHRGRGEAGLQPQAHPRAGAGVGAHGPQGPPGQGQGPPGRLREAAGRGQGGRGPRRPSCRSPSPPASGWVTS